MYGKHRAEISKGLDFSICPHATIFLIVELGCVDAGQLHPLPAFWLPP